MLLAACASRPVSLPSDNEISQSFRRPTPSSLIVLLPAQVETADLEPGAAVLMTALHRRLTAAGYKVIALDEGSYDAIWSQEVAEVGGIYDPHTGVLRRHELMLALGRLVQRVSLETHAAMVMRPQLVLRRAEISGMSATWDGQQRRVPVFGLGADTITNDGSTLGLSVGLDVFTPSGELVMHTYGGILLPYRINVLSSKNEVRSDLFANGTEVIDGVGIALKPFFNI